MFNESLFTSQISDEDVSCAQIRQIIRILNTTIPIIWVLVGTITNGLSLIVFSRKSMRRNSTFFYLALMTLSDFIVIWVGSFRDFLAYKFHFYITGTLVCRFHVFTFFLCCQFSSWLLTAANLDRLVFVISYNYSKKWCTKRTALRVAFSLLAILISINLHFLLFIDSEDHTDPGTVLMRNSSSEIHHIIHPIVYPKCLTRPGTYSHFYANYYSWIDSFVFSFIPFLIMLICNIALILRVFKTKQNLYRNVKSRKDSNPTESNAHEATDTSYLNKKKMSIYLSNPGLANDKHYFPISKAIASTDSIERMRNMAITIIGVTILFIIFTVPINIYVPIMHIAHLRDSAKKNCDDLVFCILNNMVNANHSISFFIYLTTNSKFKKEISAMTCKMRGLLRRNFNVFMLCCGFNLNCAPDDKKLVNGIKIVEKRSTQVSGVCGQSRRKKRAKSVANNFFTTLEPTRHNSVYFTKNLNSIFEASSNESIGQKSLVVRKSRTGQSNFFVLSSIEKSVNIDEKINETCVDVVNSSKLDKSSQKLVNEWLNDQSNF